MFTYIEYDKISKKQQNKFQNQLMQSLLLCIKRFHLKEYCTKNALTTIEFFYSFNTKRSSFSNLNSSSLSLHTTILRMNQRHESRIPFESNFFIPEIFVCLKKYFLTKQFIGKNEDIKEFEIVIKVMKICNWNILKTFWHARMAPRKLRPSVGPRTTWSWPSARPTGSFWSWLEQWVTAG